MILAFRFMVAGVVLCLLAACATTSTPLAPEEVIQQRAQARWDALVARDFQSAYQYLTPGFRDQTESGEYIGMMAGRSVLWTGAEVLAVTCEGPRRCTVRVNVAYTVPAGPTGIRGMKMNRTISEAWLNLAEDWWVSLD